MSVLEITPIGCKGAYPLTSAMVGRLLGNERQFSSPDNCLGGFIAAALLEDNYLPLVSSYVVDEQATLNPHLLRIFRDFTPGERTSGLTVYRGLYFQTDTAGAMTMYIRNAPTVGTLTVAQDTLALDAISGNPYVQRIANETTAPGTVVFSTPSSGSPLACGTMTAGGVIFLWFKLVLAAVSAARMYDGFDLNFDIGSAGALISFYHTLQTGVVSATITPARDGEIVTQLQGETYTVACLDSAGVAIDPPSSIVRAYASGATNNLHYQNNAYTGTRAAGAVISPCVRTGTGTYRFQFRPPYPGFWHIVFDCGGELYIEQSVEVSPVA